MSKTSLKFFVGAVVASGIASDYYGAVETEAKSANNKYIANCARNASKANERVNKAIATQFKRIKAFDLVQEEINETYDVLAKVLGLDEDKRKKVIEYIKSLK